MRATTAGSSAAEREERAAHPTKRDLVALQALDRAIAPNRLPVFVPGEPYGMAALEVAEDSLDRLVDDVARAYDIDPDDREAVARSVLDRLLPMWRPGTIVERTDDRVTITAGACPILTAASRDPRACHVCQLVQQGLVHATMPGRVVDVTVEGAIAAGDRECRLTVHLGPGRSVGATASS